MQEIAELGSILDKQEEEIASVRALLLSLEKDPSPSNQEDFKTLCLECREVFGHLKWLVNEIPAYKKTPVEIIASYTQGYQIVRDILAKINHTMCA